MVLLRTALKASTKLRAKHTTALLLTARTNTKVSIYSHHVRMSRCNGLTYFWWSCPTKDWTSACAFLCHEVGLFCQQRLRIVQVQGWIVTGCTVPSSNLKGVSFAMFLLFKRLFFRSAFWTQCLHVAWLKSECLSYSRVDMLWSDQSD